MKPLYLDGIGLWTPGCPSVLDWASGTHMSAMTRPRARLLDSRIGRYTSLLTRMAIEVYEQATTAADMDPEVTGVVFGSAYGELSIAFEQLDMIRESGLASPARFKNSVHNTAIGHISIATRNRGFGTAIAAGSTTFAMSLLEAWTWLDSSGGSAVVVVADEHMPPFLENVGTFMPIGIALALRSKPVPGRTGLRLNSIDRCNDAGSLDVPDRWRHNPAASALGLVQAAIDDCGGVVPLEPRTGGWCADIDARVAS